MKKHNNKACRIKIGENYKSIPTWRKIVGVPLVYLPLFVSLPYAILGIILVYLHLKILGAKNIKSYWDFVPNWKSHRYSLKDQIVIEPNNFWEVQIKSRLFWIFNCVIYCPLSVAVYEYHAYLVKVVENWWCPFLHEKKPEYQKTPIDKSYWHVENPDLLHPEDLNCSIWNEDVISTTHEKEVSQTIAKTKTKTPQKNAKKPRKDLTKTISTKKKTGGIRKKTVKKTVKKNKEKTSKK